MKKFIALLIALVLTLSLCGCANKKAALQEEMNTKALDVLDTVDDYISGDLSYNGAKSKMDDIEYDFDLHYKNKFSTTPVYQAVIDISLFLSENVNTQLLDSRDSLASACGKSEIFGTSHKKETLRELDKICSNAYDTIINEEYSVSLVTAKFLEYKQTKGDEKQTKIYLFFSGAPEQFVSATVSAAAAWGQDKGSFVIEAYYNGAHYATLDFSNAKSNIQIGNSKWGDNLLKYATDIRYESGDNTIKSYLNKSGSTPNAELTRSIFEQFTIATR